MTAHTNPHQPTPRETQVAIAALFGHTIKETARELGITPGTVGDHREKLFIRYGVSRVSELAAVLIGAHHD